MVRGIVEARVKVLITELGAIALRTAEKEYDLLDETSPIKLSKKGVMPPKDMLALMSIRFELTVLEGLFDEH